ncbi:hypothetical protein DIS09_16435 [Burkholderia pseudomallei]|nr:hypothetical protein DIS09_16435 [Burkholderia pseudomallei]
MGAQAAPAHAHAFSARWPRALASLAARPLVWAGAHNAGAFTSKSLLGQPIFAFRSKPDSVHAKYLIC